MYNICCFQANTTGKGYYRIYLPYSTLGSISRDFAVTIVPLTNLMQFTNMSYWKDFDCFVLHGFMPKAPGLILDFMRAAKRLKKLVIYDVDDLEWEVPKENPQYQRYKVSGFEKLFIDAMQLSDYITTTTDILANEVRQYHKNVAVFPNGIDYDYYFWNLPKQKNDGYIRVGYIGGSSHLHDLLEIKGIGKWLLKNYPNAKFVLGGYDYQIRGADGFLWYSDNEQSIWYQYRQVLFEDMTESDRIEIRHSKIVERYPEIFEDLDILLAPLKNTKFNKCKSELKLIEASARKLPVIASDIGIYGSVIKSRVNGLLVENKLSDWRRAIKKLIGDKELRQRLGNNLYETFKRKYDIKIISKKREEWLKSILERKE